MKAIKQIGLLLTLALTMCFTACSSDDDNALKGISQNELVGTWSLHPISSNMYLDSSNIWTFYPDNTCVCLSRGMVGEAYVFTYSYRLTNGGRTVELTNTSDHSTLIMSTGKLGNEEILWQHESNSDGRLDFKLIRISYNTETLYA